MGFMHVILDLVPNHTSNKHKWFQLSVNKTGKYKDYYIWNDGKNVTNGNNITRVPPNNWKSVFNGTGWTWDNTRQQFYYHQFYPAQPDLNYENEDVQKEMKEVMKFWLDIGVDGFRIDAVPHLFESNITQDEPPSNISGVGPDDHLAVLHTLTKDQPKTYELIQSWRDYVDKYAEDRGQDEKVLLTEAYSSWENTMKYYSFGSNVPFNFKFITDANTNSNADDFKNIINKWMQMKPNRTDAVPNWVMGNHDRVRVGTRYPGKGDHMVMLEMILPGVAVTYYGEEIGMEDDPELTAKPVFDFRDGCRTPFQWDNSTSAGFSKNATTWLHVNPNYKQVNLAKQKNDTESHYKLYKALTALRNSEPLSNGTLVTDVLKKDVLMVMRKGVNDTLTLLINFKNQTVPVDLSNVTKQKSTKILLKSVGAKLTLNTVLSSSTFNVPADAAVVLHSTPKSGAMMATYSITSLLLVVLISFFRS
ncbi:alpha glucosidase 2 isoform X2 [Calliopsis andreniformis]|uniref:alpha glucosidase 2 isoform X2 n=1 Tax=Calliopsis andreniformis TaxID=337506 RepID=UPI003FCC5398